MSNSLWVFGAAAHQKTQPAENDFLVEKGDLANRHPGNQRLLRDRDAVRIFYINTGNRTTKHCIRDWIIHRVHSFGGCFLKRDRKNSPCCWDVLSDKEVFENISQKLRDDRKTRKEVSNNSVENRTLINDGMSRLQIFRALDSVVAEDGTPRPDNDSAAIGENDISLAFEH